MASTGLDGNAGQTRSRTPRDARMGDPSCLLFLLTIALGATFGWMVAGPSGAVFGGILGVFLFGAAMGG